MARSKAVPKQNGQKAKKTPKRGLALATAKAARKSGPPAVGGIKKPHRYRPGTILSIITYIKKVVIVLYYHYIC
jgi:hypothetical protein